MTIQQANLIAALAGGVGLALVGYCVYFDHKRRAHPDFRRKLIEKRRSDREKQSAKNSTQYPDLMDDQAVQQFFMKEIAMGEQLLGLGDVDNGIEHLANAVAVTAHKENLLNMLRASLPDPIFALLCQRLPIVTKKIYASYEKYTVGEEEAKITEIYDEDIEEDEEAKITEIYDEDIEEDEEPRITEILGEDVENADDNDVVVTDEEEDVSAVLIDDLLD